MSRTRDYTSIPLSFNRMAVRASASVNRKRNTIHSLTEVDVTRVRGLMQKMKELEGSKPSMTAYLVTCLAHSLIKYPELNSFIKGRRLIILKDVTVSVLFEREAEGEKVPEPVGIQKAQEKSFHQVQAEIRAAQKHSGTALGSMSGVRWFRYIPGFLLKTFVRLADRNLAMARRYGKVAVTAVGMFSREAVWFVPHGTTTVLLTAGSIEKKVVETETGFESREFLCLTVSFDHDIVDGAPAARFVKDLCAEISSGSFLEN